MYIHNERTDKDIKTRFKEWIGEITKSMPTRKWTELSTGKTYTTDLAQLLGRVEFNTCGDGRVQAVLTFDIGFTEYNDCVAECEKYEMNCYSDYKDPHKAFWFASPNGKDLYDQPSEEKWLEYMKKYRYSNS